MAIEEGKKAPAFTLPDENGDKVKLTDLTGQWVVLIFSPLIGNIFLDFIFYSSS